MFKVATKRNISAIINQYIFGILALEAQVRVLALQDTEKCKMHFIKLFWQGP